MKKSKKAEELLTTGRRIQDTASGVPSVQVARYRNLARTQGQALLHTILVGYDGGSPFLRRATLASRRFFDRANYRFEFVSLPM